MKRIGIGALTLFVFLVVVSFLHNPRPAQAQGEKPKTGRVTIYGSGYAFFSMLAQNGKGVATGNDGGNGAVILDVAEGDYQLRIEGADHQAMELPVHIQAGNIYIYRADAPKGEGVQVFGKGPTVAELLARIAKLETAQCNCSKK